ncbi:MAG: erythromycin esterase family protein, partial [Saprospiraceae bacterium]|nr:erythromycin esterase family protein [Saprospiraceae bacterium]
MALFGSTLTNNITNIKNTIDSESFQLNDTDDLQPLFDQIGDARIVMLGEASHGTHEYYTWRARISRRLIEEKGFNFIGVEGDWPDAYRLNRYVKGYTNAGDSARKVLSKIERWPTWMWANWETAALGEWLKEHNQSLPPNRRVGFYGLDVYSLWESMKAIIDYLEEEDPAAAVTARQALSCFEPYGEEGQHYGLAARMAPRSCEGEVIEMLREIREKAPQYDHDPEAAFNAEQNALVARNAERYFRTMIGSGPESWNVRDHHMHETLDRLLDFHGKHSKAIVWEHNTHIGDARATQMASRGMVNVGQLARDAYSENEVVL